MTIRFPLRQDYPCLSTSSPASTHQACLPQCYPRLTFASVMTDLFSARRADGRAEWRVVYDATVDLDYDATVSYQEIADALGADCDGERNRLHRAVRRCNQQFTRERKPRVLGNVRGEGYRVLAPGDYAMTAVSMRRRASRTVSSAVELMRTAPLDDMTAEQRNWAHRVTMVMLDHENRFQTFDERQDEAERRIREIEKKVGIRRSGAVVDHDTGKVEEPAGA